MGARNTVARGLVAIVALLAAFTDTTLRKVVVIFCGVAGLVQAVLALVLMGVFLGSSCTSTAKLSVRTVSQSHDM